MIQDQVIKVNNSADNDFEYELTGIEKALKLDDVDIRLFGKKKAWNARRLGVILSSNRASGQKARNFISIQKK